MVSYRRSFLFTSESVTEGHPDKLCDGVSDAVLDAAIKQDKRSRVACEALAKTGMVVVAGEITTRAEIPYADIVRDKVRRIGYTSSHLGFDGNTCAVLVALDKQSPDIAQGVDARKAVGKKTAQQGAGDQGMMFGFACDETEELMPLPITVAHALTRKYSEVRRANPDLGLRPDGKSQVTIAYVDGRPSRIDTVVMAAQHDDVPGLETRIKEIVVENIVKPVLDRFPDLDKSGIKYYVNPTGRFVIGGPQGDTGVTGRKIIVDTYGGYARHGGGAFSGKDPSKVDRSAAYAARYLAKNVVKAGLARKCEIQVAYAIGEPRPVSVYVDTFGTGAIPEEKISARLQDSSIIDLRPGLIIERLGLLDPSRVQYYLTAKNGHFGNPAFPWEAVDLAAALAD